MCDTNMANHDLNDRVVWPHIGSYGPIAFLPLFSRGFTIILSHGRAAEPHPTQHNFLSAICQYPGKHENITPYKELLTVGMRLAIVNM